MLSLRQWSISRRILLIGTLPALLAVLLVTTYQMFQRWHELRDDSALSTETAIALMAEAAYYPVMSGNFGLIDPWAEQTLKHLTIVSITIIDEKGDVRYNRKTNRYYEIPPQDIQSLSVPISWDIDLNEEASVLGELGDAFAVPQNRQKREVRFEVSNMFLNERERDILIQSLVVGLSVVFFSMLAAGAISTTIIPPLLRISEFIAGLAGGDSHKRIRVDNGAEIGALQRGANRLARSLTKAEENQDRYLRRIKKEQQKSLEASQAKSEFLAMMSHELRTPLNGASGMLQLMELTNSPDEFEDYKEMADHSLTNLTQLLEDVLVVVDMEKSALQVESEEHNLESILEASIQEFSHRAMSKKLSFIVEYDDFLKDHSIRIDPSLIRQIIRHLVDNAIKFTDEGYVVVRLSLLTQGGGYWLGIQVSDTGIGIPADKRLTVLQAFSQAEFSFSRTHEGLGLGLTITNYICQALGGSVVLRDNSGKGTEVMATVPVSTGALTNPVTPVFPAGSDAELKILIVEDNHVNLKVAENMINKLLPKSHVYSAISGEHCLDREDLSVLDLILMDCQMPGLDGFETTRRLRELGYKIPIIACTANSSDLVQQKCKDAGMDDFLGKPLTMESVWTILKEWAPSGI